MDKCNSSATPKLKTLLVIPAYNEEDCILSVAKKIESAGYDYVIVTGGFDFFSNAENAVFFVIRWYD